MFLDLLGQSEKDQRPEFPWSSRCCFASVSYDGEGFEKAPVVSAGRQHDTANSVVTAHDSTSLIG